MSTVDEWSEQFGNIQPFKPKPRDGSYAFDLDVAYCVKVVKAKRTTSNRGDEQIKFELDVLGSDDLEANAVGRAIEYFTLPKQKSDHKLANFELVEKVTRRRFLDLLRLLSAASPKEYALYKEQIVADNGTKTFLDFDDKVMDKEAFSHREKTIHADVQLWADNVHDRVNEDLEEFHEARFYIQKVPNPKAPKYPYTNIYAVTPQKIKVFRDGSDTPF